MLTDENTTTFQNGCGIFCIILAKRKVLYMELERNPTDK